MLWTLDALISLVVLGLLGGTASEQIAKRKFWPPLGLIGAWLVAFGGALLGAWFFADILHLRDPSLLHVPIIPALVGLLILLAPWYLLRSGKAPTKYNKSHTWQQKYRR